VLVLTRRKGESLLIGDVEVAILDVDEHGRVSVGVLAPRNVQVLRSELTGAKRRRPKTLGEKWGAATDKASRSERTTKG